MFSKFIFLFAIIFASSINAASFDCQKATSVSEKIVCSNYELNKLDEVLGKNYQLMLRAKADKETISEGRRQQVLWFKEKEKCSDAQCLRSAYIQRNDEICEFILDRTTGPFECVSTSSAIQSIQKQEYDESHSKSPDQVVQEIYARHAQQVASLGFSERELSSWLYFTVQAGAPYRKFSTLGQYLAMMYELDGFKSISKVDDGEHFGFKVKVSGQPSSGFVFHLEDDEYYLTGIIQGDEIYVAPQNIQISNLFYSYGVYALGKNGAAL
ncbi:hypothetical protein IAE49_03935 [Kosakonia sp. S58]|uniref:lysozyme inhibitor LprI family protein n=1 Tax=unclassified Kosakonia TaxID=2632876 RepID=UPI001904F985|nr:MULTISPECIES: hypothetical protein [unclassified Kosakonia]MBK0078676.1 hypothetical protein [Kosakonia sp. S57]MBK0085385.1 hypothetical protein [Kosakonia sp. S58]